MENYTWIRAARQQKKPTQAQKTMITFNNKQLLHLDRKQTHLTNNSHNSIIQRAVQTE